MNFKKEAERYLSAAPEYPPPYWAQVKLIALALLAIAEALEGRKQ